MNSINKQFNIVLIGDENVGKKTWLQQFSREKNNTVTIKFDTTMGEVKFFISAPSPEEKDNDYKKADMAIIFFDLTNVSSFNNLRQWFYDFLTINPKGKFIIVGNKYDIKETKINYKQIKESIKVKYFNISAKTHYNTEQLFMYAMQDLVDRNIFITQFFPIPKEKVVLSKL